MRTVIARGALALVVVGCAAPTQQEQTDDSAAGEEEHGETPVPGCLAQQPSGTIELSVSLGTSRAFDQLADVEVDISDNVLHAFARTPNATLLGFRKLNHDGVIQYTREFGELVATDADNNVFLVGMFDRAIDFGFGLDAPHGDGHAYLVKLDPNGKTLFVQELYPCGTLSVVSIAVDAARGRLAVSGAGMGTLILDAGDGSELFRIPLVGDVAFDSVGNIAIVGEANGDALIVKLSPSGNEIFRITFAESTDPDHGTAPNRQAAVGVVFDRHDNLIVIGEFDTTLHLFGDNYFVGDPDTGDNAGGFVIKLSPAGTLRWKHVRSAINMADVAVDPLDHVIVSSTGLGGVYPYAIPAVYKLHEANGDFLWAHSDLPGLGYGTAGGVASDACGNAYWAATARVNIDPLVDIPEAFLLKLAL